MRSVRRWPLFAIPSIALLALVWMLLSHVPLGSLAHGFDAWIVGAAVAPRTGERVPIGAPHQDALPTPLVLGYYEGGAGGLGFSTLQRDADLVSGIVPDWYTIWSDGKITGGADPKVLDFAQKKGLWVFAMVQQNQYGGKVLGPLLSDPVAQRRAEENLLALCESQGFDGVNLDFEGVPPRERGDYTRFVDATAHLLHQYGYYLTLSVPAETQDAPQDGWTGAYDYKQLGQAADLVMVMAYDEHYADGSAGPIASTDWVQQVASYAARTIPPQRLVLGVPLYGYDWGQGSAQGLSFEAYQALAVKHGLSPASQDLVYWQNGVRHTAYYEGLQAFEAKVRVAISYSVRGIALWRLGLEDPRIWDYLSGP